MDRNREGRRGVTSNNNNIINNNMAAPPNGLSRRRHRSSSLRDSPDEDGTEVPEPGRLRDRGVVKKDRDRDRDRDRERDRSSRSKRRRENRMVMSNRDDGDDTTDESVNDEDDDDDEDAGNGGGLRMAPPPPATAIPSTSASHNSHPQQLHHRKSFPPVSNKVFRAAAPAAPPPAWKAADEMIGVSVPRKARSASTKRSHEWISGVASSTSPAPAPATATAAAAPPSPSSSNVSVRKKMKSNGGGGSNSRQRPPKSLSKSSSSNAEELEIEIAEVLYGLMTQSQAPSKKEVISNDSSVKFDSNKSSSEAKSRVSSPVSNSTTVPPQNSTSLSTAAPKRKRPRPVSETPVEIDHNQHHQSRQSPKTDNSSVSAAAENGGSSFGFTTLPGQKAASSPSSEPPAVAPTTEEERKCGVNVLTKEEVEKESKVVKLNDGNSKVETVIKTAASTTVTNLKVANLDTQSQKDEKFEIDLMAPPPQTRTSHGNDQDNDFSDHKQIVVNQETSKIKDDEKLRKSEKEESVKLTVDQKTGTIQEAGESIKQAVNEEINIQLNIDLEKSNKGSGSSNRSLHQANKHQQAKSESHSDKTAQSGSMPVPMSMANWPPMGYVAPLQGVISMDGNPMASTPIQPLLSHPRPKRCATHCYIARNIHYNQQIMKMNPFWPAASGSAPPMFGAKPCNLNVMPATELHANIPQSVHDKGPPAGIFPGQTITKDTKSSHPATVTDPAQRKQQVLLQQAMPPVASNNILHGPAFIFPFNQQQAVAASASVRPGSSKVTTPIAGGSGAASSATVSSSTTAAAPALSFNYPNISASETQYLAILQNNPYTFPVPAVGAPPNYRPGPHAQAMPLFNGSFYSSQMIHPSQIPQPQAPPVVQPQTHQNSSGSTSSSQKHLQGQQRQQASGAAAVNSGGSLHNTYHATHKSRSQQPAQQHNQHMNPSTGGEDSPSTADSRGSRAGNTMGVYNHNFPMPVRSKGLGQMDHSNGAMKAATANTAAGANSNDKKQQNQLQQQGLKRGGVESSLPPQTFAMSFAPMNGTTGTAQNHAIFQSLPESLKPSFHMMSAPTSSTAHHSQQKDFRITEEASRTTVTGHDASNADEDRKVSAGLTAKSGQSIAFSRPDLPTDVLSGSNNRPSRSPISTSIATAAQSSHSLNAQFQQTQQQAIERARQHHQQQALQLQKGQQLSQAINAYAVGARSKNPPSSNGSAYPEHTISSSSATAKFPNSISSFPLQTSNSSQVQSPQWRNSVRGPTTSQVPSSLTSATSSSAKNLQQSQQSSRSHQQSHTQISFGSAASQKLQPTTSVQMQQQQQQNQNPGSNSGNRCSSPPMLVSSPTTSMSKGGGSGGGSPRTNAAAASTSGRTGQASSLSSSQQAKNSPVPRRSSSPSILGNPNNSNSSKSQQQLQKQALQQQQQKVQAMMMYNHPYMQAQAQAQVQQQQHAASSMALYRLQQQQSASSSSTATLSLCPPVTHASAATSDPAKAIAAATSMMNHPQYGGAPPSMPAGFPQYVHNAPVAAAAAAAAVQVKPVDQKQPAGE